MAKLVRFELGGDVKHDPGPTKINRLPGVVRVDSRSEFIQNARS